MTAPCREACCSVTPRLTVSELFERGFLRNRTAPLPIEGAALTDADGNTARFSVDTIGETIAGVSFRASSCATLIAYCEYLAEVTPGFRFDIASAFTATSLVEALHGVPALKRARAVLAVAAFRAALAHARDRFPSATEGSL
jgi:NifU-like protein involved in Fe-S cluster formation